MKLILVRHGAAAENQSARAEDPPLAPLGRQQAERVAEFLAREQVGRIVSSPLARALETAEPLALRLGRKVEVVDGWAEADRHAGPYRSVHTMKALGLWGDFLRDPLAFYGRDAAQFRAEVLGALAESVDKGGEGCTVVFTHGLVINLVLSHALGLEKIIHFAPGNGSLTRLRGAARDALGVVSVNETLHLEDAIS